MLSSHHPCYSYPHLIRMPSTPYQHAIPSNGGQRPLSSTIPTHVYMQALICNTYLTIQSSHLIRYIMYLHASHRTSRAPMHHHSNRQLWPTPPSPKHAPPHPTTITHHQRHHVLPSTASHVQPFHRHPSPTPTSPNLAPATSDSSAATPTRTAKPDTKPNVKTKPSVSRPTSAKRTAHPKTSSGLHRPDLANSAPTPRTANTTFPHLRDQGACSKCGKNELIVFYTSSYDSRSNHPYKHVILCLTCRKSTTHLQQAFTNFHSTIHKNYQPIVCYECKEDHFDQFYTLENMDPKENCFHQQFCCNSNNCLKKQHSASVPYFGPPITTELLQQWGY